MDTMEMEEEVRVKAVPPEPPKKRIPVRLDRNTIIMVPEGADIEKHVKRYKNRDLEGIPHRGLYVERRTSKTQMIEDDGKEN